MTRHNIRLRRRFLSSQRRERYKDYDNIMDRYNKTVRFRKLVRIVVYLLLVLIIVFTMYLLALI